MRNSFVSSIVALAVVLAFSPVAGAQVIAPVPHPIESPADLLRRDAAIAEGKSSGGQRTRRSGGARHVRGAGCADRAEGIQRIRRSAD